MECIYLIFLKTVHSDSYWKLHDYLGIAFTPTTCRKTFCSVIQLTASLSLEQMIWPLLTNQQLAIFMIKKKSMYIFRVHRYMF